MSHFTVMVVLPKMPTKRNELLEKALQPFHEFECTGKVDRYVQSVDRTEELRESYKTETATLVVQRPDGSKVYAFDDQGDYIEELQPFYVEVPGEFHKKLVLPDGYQELGDEPLKDYQTFSSYCVYNCGPRVYPNQHPDIFDRHKWGWTRVGNGKVVAAIRRTNPNKRWDWWQVGGRWSGKLLAKNRVEATKGRPGILDAEYNSNGVDICKVGNLDFEAMRKINVKVRHDSVFKPLEKKGIAYVDAVKVWLEYLDAAEDDRAAWQATENYGPYYTWIDNLPDNHPVKVFTRGPVGSAWGNWGAQIPQTIRDPLQWIDAAPALTSWAYLQDGEWSEKGEMGWFGMSSNDRDPEEWETEVTKRVESLPADYWVAMVDCHI